MEGRGETEFHNRPRLSEIPGFKFLTLQSLGIDLYKRRY